jgi:hypothetical protein
MRWYFDPKKARHYNKSAPVNITSDIKAIYVEGKDNYGNLILLSKDDKIILVGVGHYHRSLYCYKLPKLKEPFLYINWKSIDFIDLEIDYSLNYGCQENYEKMEKLTATEIFNLMDEPELIRLIPLPKRPEIKDDIQLR